MIRWTATSIAYIILQSTYLDWITLHDGKQSFAYSFSLLSHQDDFLKHLLNILNKDVFQDFQTKMVHVVNYDAQFLHAMKNTLHSYRP